MRCTPSERGGVLIEILLAVLLLGVFLNTGQLELMKAWRQKLLDLQSSRLVYDGVKNETFSPETDPLGQ